VRSPFWRIVGSLGREAGEEFAAPAGVTREAQRLLEDVPGHAPLPLGDQSIDHGFGAMDASFGKEGGDGARRRAQDVRWQVAKLGQRRLDIVFGHFGRSRRHAKVSPQASRMSSCCEPNSP
jgi:hypothetical protein